MLCRVLLIVSVLLLSACSRTELVYRNADWLAYRWVDNLLDADQAQSERWPQLLESLMQEHRRELLPELVVFLRQAAVLVDRGLSAEDLGCLWQGTNRLIEAHAHLIAPTAAQILSGISAAQIENLRAQLQKRNVEYREAYLNPDPLARESARIERFTRRIERWTGELSTEQLRLVEAGVQNMPDAAGDWLDYRKRQQQRLLAILSEGGNPQALESFLVAWWAERADRGPALAAAYPQLRDRWIQLLAELDATLDERQRAHLLASFVDLRDDLAGEIERGVGVTAQIPAGLDPYRLGCIGPES